MPDRAPKRKRHGGYAQNIKAERRERSSASTGPIILKSTLAVFLVHMWAWGVISPQLVQNVAALCWDDMAVLNSRNARNCGINESEFDTFSDIGKLKSIGSEGAYSGNCHRDLVEILGNNPIPVSETSLPTKVLGTLGYTISLHHIIWPHELFSTIYHKYPESWKKYHIKH